jgi:hypothetical protein
MKTKSIEIAVNETSTTSYPNCYIVIPPNGKVCSVTGLRHTHLYNLLSDNGSARPFVRVVNLREPGAKKGKTLFHVGDMLCFLDSLAKLQGSGELRGKESENQAEKYNGSNG